MQNSKTQNKQLLNNRPNIPNYPVFEQVEYDAGDKSTETTYHPEVVFVADGSVSLSYAYFPEVLVRKGQMLLIPSDSEYTVKAQEDSSIVVLRMHPNACIANCSSLEEILCEKMDETFHIHTLDMDKRIWSYISSFISVPFDDETLYKEYHLLKIQELFFLLSNFYPKEKLLAFFQPLIANDDSFIKFILQNYRSVKTVKEFAELYACSLSSFEKRFNQVFSCPPYRWMLKKKANLILEEISNSNKPFGQIAKENGFLSLPQFSDFCKKHLGVPPGKIRKRKETRSPEEG